MKAIDIIRYEGDNDTFIWKHPCEDFNTLTQLIVHESQEAVFFQNGQALDLFGPGRHTLETQNIPLLRRIQSIPTGGQTPFHCEVYFVNKTEQMPIKWGTDSHVEYLDPTYGFPLKLGASGGMSLKVGNARKLLVKLVGTEKAFDREKLTAMFRALLMSKVKPYLAQTMLESRLSIFDADSQMDRISGGLQQRLAPDFADYGLELVRFFVTTIVKPEGDPLYEKFKELHLRRFADVTEAEIRQQVGVIDQTTEAKRTVIQAQGVADKRRIEGYSYQQERGFDVAQKVAENEGAGNFSSAGIGLGMMGGVAVGMGAGIAGMTSDALKPVTQAQAAPAGGIADFQQKVDKLLIMKNSGLLTDAEFEAAKQQLLSQL